MDEIIVKLHSIIQVGCLMRGVFFVKQKTAYEMRISDWSSDVCSSDLIVGGLSNPSISSPGSSQIEIERGPSARVMPCWRSQSSAAVSNAVATSASSASSSPQFPVPGPIPCSAGWARASSSICAEIRPTVRSEEHTSELQSLMRSTYAAFCLKKK